MRSSFRGLRFGVFAALLAILFSAVMAAPQPAFAANIVWINEVDADQTGNDIAEYVELYDGGVGNTALDGLVLVGINGSDDASYWSVDLDGQTTDGNGFFVYCNEADNLPACDLEANVADNYIQNGADAVGLFMDDASNFPGDTPVTSTNLVDAIVYDTNDSDDTVLIDTLLIDGGQVNEDGGGNKDTESNQRCDNAGGLRSTVNYVQATPTPGATNAVCAVSGDVGDLLLTEIVVTPTGGEFVEIYNRGPGTVDLTDVYLTDATFAGGSVYYYQIVTGGGGGGTNSDFHARFPNGATIAAGEYQTIAMNGSADFLTEYSVAPTYELYDDASADGEALMLEATSGSINNQGGLTNSGEAVFLYYWDGTTDLVQDLDQGVWGDKVEAVDKTSVSIDGPDGDTTDSTYLADTAIASQDVLDTGSHTFGLSWQRGDFSEGAETQSGGNGFDGSDETSEDYGNTWCELAPTPGAVNGTCPVSTLTIGTCGDGNETFIGDVQGTGDGGAVLGEAVLEGVVVGDLQDGLNGFFMQEEDADAATEGDATSSEGIFVDHGGSFATDVAEGDVVRVLGTVEESFGMTQIDITSGDFLACGTATLPTPASIDLPVVGDIDDFYEQYEGMLVSFSDTLYVSEYFELYRYGQVILYEGSRPYQFTQTNTPDAAGLTAHLEDLDRRRVILDDDDNQQNSPLPNGVIYHPQPNGFGVGTHGTDFFRGNDEVQNLVGVLHWSWAGSGGTDAWRVRPTTSDPVDFTPTNARPASPDPVGGNITVGTLNVLNYFTTLDDGSDICGPGGDQGCRGANSTQELDRQAEKIVAALNEMDADVVGLVELENSGTDAAIADLVSRLNAVSSRTYDYIAIGFVGSDAITNGIIYDTDTLSQVGSTAVLDSANFLNPNDVEDGNGNLEDQNRPAVTASFEVQTGPDAGAVFTVSVNHFKSKGSDCSLGDLPDDDTTTGQGNCNLTRTLGAEVLAEWLGADPTGAGDADVLILGDLNSYAQEDPITALTGSGYTDLLQQFVGSSVYTYLFDGQVGTLDYIMANDDILAEVTGATAWNINADEVPLFDYNDDVQDPGEAFFQEEPDGNTLYSPDAYRASDHDAVLIGLDLNPTVPGPATFTATYNATDHQGELAWSDVTGETGYVIERQKVGATDWLELTTVAADTTSYIDGIVTCDQDYVYRITPIGDFASAQSNIMNTECNLFADVPTDLPAPFMEPWVEDFFQADITGGKPNCDVTSPVGSPTYCPQDNVTRGEIAVFILRALEYPNLPYDPPGDPTDPFVDVFAGSTALPAPFMEDFIEEFLDRGITGGKGTCVETASSPDLTYCPKDKVTRAEIAVFILKALNITPVDDISDPFVDVPGDLPAPFMEAYVETFLAEGFTTGKPSCEATSPVGSPTFCPQDNVTRGEMAVFILRAFDSIPDPNDP